MTVFILTLLVEIFIYTRAHGLIKEDKLYVRIFIEKLEKYIVETLNFNIDLFLNFLLKSVIYIYTCVNESTKKKKCKKIRKKVTYVKYKMFSRRSS